MMETYPRKTQKGCELKSLGRSCGQGSFKFSKPGFKGEFVLNQIRSITIQYSCINCISAPSICITKNLLLCFFFFFFVKRKTYNKYWQCYKHGPDLPSASDNRIPIHSSQSQVQGGGFVRRPGRKMFLCLCQLCLPAITGQAAFFIRIAFCVKHLIIRK